MPHDDTAVIGPHRGTDRRSLTPMKIPQLRYRDQRIAVFGESGSGKTVLLSSFYGSAQEPAVLGRSPFRITAEDPGQGNRLNKYYLGMKNEAAWPEATRFRPETYTFSVTMATPADAKRKRQQPFDALRLTWFDYPGEWFEQNTAGYTEATSKAETFENLLRSDIAFLLVDGERLRRHAGEEAKYLKSLLHNYRTGLLALQHRLTSTGAPLDRFPRIWILALTKTDLMGDLDVYGFRDLVIENAADDLDELRKQIGAFVGDADALSVGEDFLLVSSAHFEPDRIAVERRVGVDLILPLSAILPFERHVWWAQKKLLPGRIAQDLLGRADTLAHALLDGQRRLPMIITKSAKLNKLTLLLGLIKPEHIQAALDLAGKHLEDLNNRAVADHDHLLATLTGFKLALERAEAAGVLLRSRR